MPNLSDLKLAVVKEPTVKQSVLVLLNNLANHVMATAGDKAASEELARDIGASAEEMATAVTTNTPATPTVRPAADTALHDSEELRTDGPTLAEYVKAGYNPTFYPPRGYAAKTDPSDAQVLADWHAANPLTKAQPEQQQPSEFGILSFQPVVDGDTTKYFIRSPWPSKVRAPAAALEAPMAKVSGSFVTFWAENGRATYKADDITADPVVLNLQPDASTYREAPAA